MLGSLTRTIGGVCTLHFIFSLGIFFPSIFINFFQSTGFLFPFRSRSLSNNFLFYFLFVFFIALTSVHKFFSLHVISHRLSLCSFRFLDHQNSSSGNPIMCVPKYSGYRAPNVFSFTAAIEEVLLASGRKKMARTTLGFFFLLSA